MLYVFWIASILAAAAFFAAGYWTAKWRRPAPRASLSAKKLSSIAGRDYDGIVSKVAATDGVRCVALADEQGLTIAGRGDDQDGLAALSGVLFESAVKAKKLVAMGSVMRIHVETDGGTAVNAYPVAVGGNEIILATLTVGPGADDRELRRVLQQNGGTR
jgi:predicted regulator of Ras-like GTPase activity (Roadblock/LC7/MglB family)